MDVLVAFSRILPQRYFFNIARLTAEKNIDKEARLAIERELDCLCEPDDEDNAWWRKDAPMTTNVGWEAWDLDSQYSDLVTFINMRIGTIYVGTGVIQRIIATAPQLAVMDIGNENFEKLVMLENSSKTTWTVGTRYRIYGEAYGMYGSMPRLTVRYTYVEE